MKEMFPELSDLEIFENLLKSHDWTYHYSDDHRYYIKGRDESQRIRLMLAKLCEDGFEEEANALYVSYRPEFI